MKKMMLLMLTLLIMSAANVNAQVRIGGTMDPDPSAALDVNKTDDLEPAGNLGLGLPRVALTSATQELATGKTPKPGTMIYNTGTSLGGAGVYYWATNAWVKLSTGAGLTLGTTATTALAGNTTHLSGDVASPATAVGETANKTLTYGGTFTVPYIPTGGGAPVARTMTMPAAPAAPDLSAYAPKASPALTGTPTTPIAAAGTNTTQIASTAFVKAAVDAKANDKGITQLTGDVTAPSTTNGSAEATIKSGAVTSAKLADNSVTSAKIVDQTIVAGDIANSTITGAQLASSIALAGSPTPTTQPTGPEHNYRYYGFCGCDGCRRARELHGHSELRSRVPVGFELQPVRVCARRQR
jgi:hypothetical protein